MIDIFETTRGYSDGKISALRSSLASVVSENHIAITFGSYARREASASSDIDYLIVVDDEDAHYASDEDYKSKIEEAVGSIVEIEPASDGAFGKIVRRSDLITNLGGGNDTNATLTRRLLLMLEGEWLTNELQFHGFRRELIDRYTCATPRDHQLALFLLNDIIRYWRTITVDYMYKTTEGNKPWAIRNIKLVFSRKLMYASGLFAVAGTVDKSCRSKSEHLDRLFRIPALDRLRDICGSHRISGVLECYALFLSKMEDPLVRKHLTEVASDDHNDETFRELKNSGHVLTRELLSVLSKTFHSSHPIHRAVVF